MIAAKWTLRDLSFCILVTFFSIAACRHHTEKGLQSFWTVVLSFFAVDLCYFASGWRLSTHVCRARRPSRKCAAPSRSRRWCGPREWGIGTTIGTVWGCWSRLFVVIQLSLCVHVGWSGGARATPSLRIMCFSWMRCLNEKRRRSSEWFFW